ncbi:hypothetical protein Cni_G22554 [Canna indica]|uniref:Thioredoxin domain-containing protein n=1 Tax=Canna indica TaxID=4628 RepID=A0AAQ3KST9_9LILI|nr:hypothetical protein Cni_G22554 [Canna indica]
MKAKPRCGALLFLIAFSGLAAGSPVCLRPSAGDFILGRPDACWDLDPSVSLGAYTTGFGVVEGDEAALQKALNIVQRNRDDYVALLFYASWCPFSKLCQPNFQILSNLFPTIRHFAFEESVIRPSILSRYGVHGFPTLVLLNSTMRVRYHGSRTVNSLSAFYNHVTGNNPAPMGPMSHDKIMYPPDDPELTDMQQENCPFSWARSPENLLQQDGYLALASCFLLMRLLHLVLPYLSACFQRAWRRQMRYASSGNLWNYLQTYLPCKQSNLQENAMNARAWASQSLATVSLGESSSGRTPSTSERN